MKLRRLRLQNFRQHAATELDFRDGVTGIIGPNGAGKSTILEAIAWAIYGSSAARGTNDTIRFARAPGRSRVEVDLSIDIGANEYRVVRSLNGAEVFLDGSDAPVATGIGGATGYLQSRLGMSREEFFNTYFTGQKELQFLAQMGPAQRGRFLSQVLGYERLRLAQQAARERRNALRHEADGLLAALPDVAVLRRASEAAERRLRETTVSLETARAAHAGAQAELDALKPRWLDAQRARERSRELAHAVEVADRERETAERDAERASTELKRIAEADARLVVLRGDLEALPGLVETCERQSELARRDERRRAQAEREVALAEELAESVERMKRLEQAPELLRQVEAQLADRHAALDEAEQGVEQRHREWVGTRQDVRTKLDQYRDRARELKEQIAELREAGPDGTCPTCERPLGAEFENVVGRLEDEWQTLVQDGKWLSQRAKQLEQQPPELERAEALRADIRRLIEGLQERHGRCIRAAEELGVLVQESERKEETLDRLRAELAELQTGYDAEAHRAAERRLEELRAVEREVARLEQVVEARATRERERGEAQEVAAAAAQRIAALEKEHAEIAFDEGAYRGLGAAHEAATDAARRAELKRSETSGEVRAAEQALAGARDDETAYRERRAKLDDLETEVRHHNELDAAFSRLRQELNDRVRPELGELASRFLAEITDGRYTSIEIDDSYNILVLDEGDEKPVISGGEEDIANLVLRLAISQMIAERAGHPLSILILDEVFGSLDVDRRDNVIQLLHRLGDRFEQVILITHIETVHDGLDNVVRVDFDERTGASIVRTEEGPAPEAELIEA